MKAAIGRGDVKSMRRYVNELNKFILDHSSAKIDLTKNPLWGENEPESKREVDTLHAPWRNLSDFNQSGADKAFDIMELLFPEPVDGPPIPYAWPEDPDSVIWQLEDIVVLC